MILNPTQGDLPFTHFAINPPQPKMYKSHPEIAHDTFSLLVTVVYECL